MPLWSKRLLSDDQLAGIKRIVDLMRLNRRIPQHRDVLAFSNALSI
jgi:hypothetical protein